MTTLEDKILGEKAQYYCSSSEDEGRDDGDEKDGGDGADEEDGGGTVRGAACAGDQRNSTFDPDPSDVEPNLAARWRGGNIATNTGPKGVIKDWQRYKQLETEKREEQEAEKLRLMKKLCVTCAPEVESDKEKDKKKNKKKGKSKHKKDDEDEEDDIDKFLEEDDGFFDAYLKQRMEEMISRYERLPMFGQVVELLSGPEFLRSVDDEHKDVTVFVHLFKPDAKACVTLNKCLSCLAAEYSRGFKFCTLDVKVVNMTELFQSQGVPALLVYRGGSLVGNFVRLGDEFKLADVDHLDYRQVAKFLVEHGYLPDPSLVPRLVRPSAACSSSSSSSSAAAKSKTSSSASSRLRNVFSRRRGASNGSDDDD